MKRYLTAVFVLISAVSIYGQSVRNDQMKLSLNRIEVCDSLMRFEFRLSNRSAVRYVPHVIEYTIKDRRVGKRTAQQETVLVPSAVDPVGVLRGDSSLVFSAVFPAIILPKAKEMQVRIAEAEGARSLAVRINNRKLLRADKSILCEVSQ